MNQKKPRLSSIFLSSILVLSSFAPAVPVLAGPEFQGPAKISAENLHLANLGSTAKTGAARSLVEKVQGLRVAGSRGVLPPSKIVEAAPTAPAASAPAAAETAPSSTSETPAAPAARKTLYGLAKAFASNLLGITFDHSRALIPASAVGIRHFPDRPKNLPEGVVLDSAPKPSSAHELPTKVTPNGVEEPAPAPVPNAGVFGADEMVLKADPTSPADIEKELRALVIQKTGVADSELITERVKVQSKINAVYVRFYQQKTAKKADGTSYNIPVDGAELNFTVKIIKGQARIVIPPASSPISADINVDTTQKLSDADLRTKAQQRISSPNGTALSEVVELGRSIIYMKGSWHTANIYTRKDGQVMIAVDISSGEAFAWDSRLGVDARKGGGSGKNGGKNKKTPPPPPAPTPAPDGPVLAKVDGRAETDGERPNGVPVLTAQGISYLTARTKDGRAVETDAAGGLRTSDGQPLTGPTEVTLTLESKYAKVEDEAGNPQTVAGTLVPGKTGEFHFYAKGSDDKILAQLNAIITYHRELDYARAHGLDDASLNDKITIRVNVNENCNAYYDPSDHSLNFFIGNDECINTSKPDVIMHETGHRIHFAIGGYAGFMIHVMSRINGGLSEGWGDVFAIYVRKADPKKGLNPVIGSGFFLKRVPNFIRTALNNYQYNPQDEVHVVGQALDAVLYKFGQALWEKEGDAGIERAAQFIFPTMHANASDIPAALREVWLAMIDADGKNPYDSLFRSLCEASGIKLPPRRGGPGLADLVASTVKPLATMSTPLSSIEVEQDETEVVSVSFEEPKSSARPQDEKPMIDEVSIDAAPRKAKKTIKTTLVISAGRLKRAQARSAFETAMASMPGDYADFTRVPSLTESQGLLGSRFTIEIEGAEDSVYYLAEQLKRLSGAKHTPHRHVEQVRAQYEKLQRELEGWDGILNTLKHGDYDAQVYIMEKYYPGKTVESVQDILSGKIRALQAQISELKLQYPSL